MVAKAVIHSLELVQVEHEHGEREPVATCSQDTLLKPVSKQGPVRQAREGVMKCLVSKRFLYLFALRHVPHGRDNGPDLSICSANGGQNVLLHRGARSVTTRETQLTSPLLPCPDY